jgi:hypothetical protein
LHCLVAVWLDSIATELRPYGLETAVGIQLTEAGGLEAVAKEVIEAVRRWQQPEMQDGNLAPEQVLAREKSIARLKIQAIDELARETDLQQDDIRNAYGKIIDMHIIQILPPWRGPFHGI